MKKLLQHKPIYLFHASKVPKLNKDGLKINKDTTCCNEYKSREIYFGSIEYIKKDYFSYCPKGMYFIYKINVEKLNIIKVNAGDQWKTRKEVSNNRIEFYDEYYKG